MDGIMRIAECIEVTGSSRTTIWRRVLSSDFTAPVKLGGPTSRSVGLGSRDVDGWIESSLAIGA